MTFNQSKYIVDYVKKNYKRYEIRLKKDEQVKLEQVLKKNNIKLKDYVLDKVNQDIKKD